MGRGRQKAKQTKVARKLKYFSPETDYDALQRELQSANGSQRQGTEPAEDYDPSEEDWRNLEIPPATDDDWYR